MPPLHCCAGPLRGWWHRHRRAGYPAAGAGDTAVVSYPPPPSTGRAETGRNKLVTSLLSYNFSFNHKAFISKHLDAALYIKGYHNFFLSIYLRSLQTGKIRREINAFWSWEKTQTPLPHLATNQRSRNWTVKGVMGQAKVPADPKPKTCSQKYKSMNLQMTLKTFPATLKMMLPTGPQQLTKYICLVYFLFDVSFFSF